MAEKKEYWNKGRLYKDSKSGRVTGSVTIFVNSDSIKEAKVTMNNKEQTIGKIFGSGKFSKGVGIEYAIGEEFVSKEKYANFSVSLLQYALESYKKVGVKKGDVIRIYGTFTPNTYTDGQGVERKSINVLCDSIDVEYMKKDGQGNTNAAPTQAPAEAEDIMSQQQLEDEFSASFESFDDDIQF